MYRFFGNFRYFRLFFEIDGKNIMELSKKHGTISHLSIVTDQFVKEGLITKEKKGREIEISLTEEGQEFLGILKTFDDFVIKQKEKIEKGEETNEN